MSLIKQQDKNQYVQQIYCISVYNKLKKGKLRLFLFTIALEHMKFLRVNITSEVKDVRTENYKKLLKEWSWSHSTVDGAFALHLADSSLISGILYCPLSTTRVISQCRAWTDN